MVTREYPPFTVGGIATHTYNLTKYLRKMGIYVKVISFGDPKMSTEDTIFIEPRSSIISREITAIDKDIRIPLDVLRFISMVKKILRKEHFNVIHVQEPYVGGLISFEHKVTTIHDTSFGEVKGYLKYFDSSSLKRLAFYVAMGYAMELASISTSKIIINPSIDVAWEMIKVYRVPRNKIRVVPNGVEEPSSNEPNKDEAREILGIPTDLFIIFTTAQHIDFIHSIKRNLESQGFLVHVGEGDGRISKPGLVLGCNFSSALHGNANSIVFIGTGNFHPVGISLATPKPVYALDPISMKIKMPEEIANEKDKLLKKRYSLIALSKDANKFGIIISSKIGQRRLELAMRLKEEIEKMGKDAHLLVLDNVNPSSFRDFGKFDCLISTACPRIAIDDYDNFDSPILTPIEFEILVGRREVNKYVLDSIS